MCVAKGSDFMVRSEALFTRQRRACLSGELNHVLGPPPAPEHCSVSTARGCQNDLVVVINLFGSVSSPPQRSDEGVLIDRRIDVPIGIGRNPDR